ncbi:MAG: hypothetical protein ABSA57_16165 [Candidatus Acidiferrales bacterium]
MAIILWSSALESIIVIMPMARACSIVRGATDSWDSTSASSGSRWLRPASAE